jgi:hypothetical protein
MFSRIRQNIPPWNRRNDPGERHLMLVEQTSLVTALLGRHRAREAVPWQKLADGVVLCDNRSNSFSKIQSRAVFSDFVAGLEVDHVWLEPVSGVPQISPKSVNWREWRYLGLRLELVWLDRSQWVEQHIKMYQLSSHTFDAVKYYYLLKNGVWTDSWNRFYLLEIAVNQSQFTHSHPTPDTGSSRLREAHTTHDDGSEK